MKTKRIVVDTSYVMSWLLPDEKSPKLVKGQLISPELLVYEVINALKTSVRRRRITDDIAQQLLHEFESWHIQYFKVDNQSVLNLAITEELSGYDASYLYLARKMKCELLTWDKKLGKLV
ncbi:MAG: type II toxin-antitoxin system VapC family toxin [bacterium]